MKLFKQEDLDIFVRLSKDNRLCYKFLSELKWSEGFHCSRCKGISYIKGKKIHSRRCRNCGYDESVTSGTIFHKLKFDICKAMAMFYDIIKIKEGVTSVSLAKRYNLNQKTTWKFRQKVLKAKANILMQELHTCNGNLS
ncbi:transposase [Sphingobacterium bambusae]|uniref:Transposase n=1 Tax=Sphingobacterium bambusae TaxID=662858 RepID=A0ABW6BHU4_9SPHI